MVGRGTKFTEGGHSKFGSWRKEFAKSTGREGSQLRRGSSKTTIGLAGSLLTRTMGQGGGGKVSGCSDALLYQPQRARGEGKDRNQLPVARAGKCDERPGMRSNLRRISRDSQSENALGQEVADEPAGWIYMSRADGTDLDDLDGPSVTGLQSDIGDGCCRAVHRRRRFLTTSASLGTGAEGACRQQKRLGRWVAGSPCGGIQPQAFWCMRARRGEGCRISHLTRGLKGQSVSRSSPRPTTLMGSTAAPSWAPLAATEEPRRRCVDGNLCTRGSCPLNAASWRRTPLRTAPPRAQCRASAVATSEEWPAAVVGEAVDVCMRAWLTSDRGPWRQAAQCAKLHGTSPSTPHDGMAFSEVRRQRPPAPCCFCPPAPTAPTWISSQQHAASTSDSTGAAHGRTSSSHTPPPLSTTLLCASRCSAPGTLSALFPPPIRPRARGSAASHARRRLPLSTAPAIGPAQA